MIECTFSATLAPFVGISAHTHQTERRLQNATAYEEKRHKEGRLSIFNLSRLLR